MPVRRTSLPSMVWLVLAPTQMSLSLESPLAFSSKPSVDRGELTVRNDTRALFDR